MKRCALLLPVVLLNLAAPGCGGMFASTVRQNIESTNETARLCGGMLPIPRAGGADQPDIYVVDLGHDFARRVRAYLGDIRVLFTTDVLPDPAKVDALTASLEAAQIDALRKATDAFTQSLGTIETSASTVADCIQKGLTEARDKAPDDHTSRYTSTLKTLRTRIQSCGQEAVRLLEGVNELDAAYIRFEHAAAAARGELMAQKGNGQQLEVLRDLTARVRTFQAWMSRSRGFVDGLAGSDATRALGALAERELGGVSKIAFDSIRTSIRQVDRQLQNLDAQVYGGITLFSAYASPEVTPMVKAIGCTVGCQVSETLSKMDVSPESIVAEACAALRTNQGDDDELAILGGILPHLYTGMVRGLSQRCDDDQPASAQPAAPAAPTSVAGMSRPPTRTGAHAGSAGAGLADLARPPALPDVPQQRAKPANGAASKEATRTAPAEAPRVDDEARRKEIAEFQKTSAGATMLSEWTAQLVFQQAHGLDAASEPTRLAALRNAHAEAILRAPPVEPSEKSALVGRVKEDERIATIVNVIAQAIVLRGPIDVHVDGAGVGADIQPLVDKMASLQDMLNKRDRLYQSGQDLAALCGLLSVDPLLQDPDVTVARCSDDRATAERPFNIATISADMKYPDGEWDVATAASDISARLDEKIKHLAGSRQAPAAPEAPINLLNQLQSAPLAKGKRMAVLRERARQLVEHMKEAAGNQELTLRVRGFASAKELTCAKMAAQLQLSDLPECKPDVGGPCYAVKWKMDGTLEQFEISLGNGAAVHTCTPKNENATLSALRAWAMRDYIERLADSSPRAPWDVKLAPGAFNMGHGKAQMQRVLIQVLPSRGRE
ncbi:hypothetical protein [Sorangium sp. So ce1335]|uniref:hypothetical protein n=1 Tax=Sorangium sp. So ce1335 TaxID=3133335 RepID=UPI003F6265D8